MTRALRRAPIPAAALGTGAPVPGTAIMILAFPGSKVPDRPLCDLRSAWRARGELPIANRQTPVNNDTIAHHAWWRSLTITASAVP